MLGEASRLRDFRVLVQAVQFEVVEREPGFSGHKMHRITWDLVKGRLWLGRSGVGVRFCISNKLPSEGDAAEAVMCLARAAQYNVIPAAWPSSPSS